MTSRADSPEDTARRGELIYERLRAELGPQHHGKVVAIDINTEAYEVADDVLTACQGVLARVPDADI